MTSERPVKRTKSKYDNVIPYVQEGDYFFVKGVEAFYKRKFDIALKFLNRAKDIDPKEALYPSQMSIIYTEIGAYHAANQILSEVIKSHGDTYADSYYLIANNYAHLGLLNEAQKYAGLYMEKAPEGEFFSEAEQLLTVLDMTLEDEEEWFEDEDDILVYQETSFYHLQHRNYEEAKALLEEAFILYPDHSMFRQHYRQCLFHLGDKEKAIKEEMECLAEDPLQINSRAQLIFFYAALGEDNLAHSHVLSFKNVYPMHEEQALKIAISYTVTGLYEEALHRFKMLSKNKVRHYLDYYRYFALTLYHSGEEAQAKEQFNEGQQLHQALKGENPPWLKVESK